MNEVSMDDKENTLMSKSFLKHGSSSSEEITMIAFINCLSGTRAGKSVLEAIKIHHFLGPDRIFNLSKGGPELGLKKFKDAPGLRILICGGDGTINWVLSTIHSLMMCQLPTVGIIPLGTGNDTARAFGWGSKFESIHVVNKMINYMAKATGIISFDRWNVSIQYKDKHSRDVVKSRIERTSYEFNSYLSFGIGPQILRNFHMTRENCRSCFHYRCCSYFWLGLFGTVNCCCCQASNLDAKLEFVNAENQKWETINVAKYKGIIFLNIQSYASGKVIWPKYSSDIKPSADDGVLEIIGVKNSCHLALMTNGCLYGVRIGQAKEVRFTSLINIYVQKDGEPWEDKPAVYHIRRHQSANMLIGPNNCPIKRKYQRKNN